MIILFAKKKLLKILLFRSFCEEGWLKLLVAVQSLANFMLCQISDEISCRVTWKNILAWMVSFLPMKMGVWINV